MKAGNKEQKKHYDIAKMSSRNSDCQLQTLGDSQNQYPSPSLPPTQSNSLVHSQMESQRMVTHSDIMALLNCYKNVDDVIKYNCPTHLQQSFHDSAKDSHKSPTIPEYLPPGPIHISTMTTVCLQVAIYFSRYCIVGKSK